MMPVPMTNQGFSVQIHEPFAIRLRTTAQNVFHSQIEQDFCHDLGVLDVLIGLWGSKFFELCFCLMVSGDAQFLLCLLHQMDDRSCQRFWREESLELEKHENLLPYH